MFWSYWPNTAEANALSSNAKAASAVFPLRPPPSRVRASMVEAGGFAFNASSSLSWGKSILGASRSAFDDSFKRIRPGARDFHAQGHAGRRAGVLDQHALHIGR